jgi:threonylcarbamoyladenosine tRNA methylthiotransferase MtaB
MKVYLDMVGCRLNQSEIETYARQFRAAGHSLVSTPEAADLVVINTCTVTAAAASDSRHKIRQAGRAGANQIIVTGCWATLNPAEAAALPGVSAVVPNSSKDQLVRDTLELPGGSFDHKLLKREPLPGARRRTRAFIKVQDGCDNRCTFCITTLARGAGRSRPVMEVIEDIRLATGGINQPGDYAQEAVLTGVHLGSWGLDFEPRLNLTHLVKAILEQTKVARLRLSSLEPWDLEEVFFSLWEDRRLCRHLHLPLQSGSAGVLQRMARKTTPEAFARLVATARRLIPEVAITTDIIVGFPGESEAEFAESLAFVQEMEFAKGHVFTYSARPGTAAAKMAGQVPPELRKERSARMRAVLAASQAAYMERFVGRSLPVLWESACPYGEQSWEVSGLTDNYLRVSAHSPRPLWNQITPVELTTVQGEGLIGVLDMQL